MRAVCHRGERSGDPRTWSDLSGAPWGKACSSFDNVKKFKFRERKGKRQQNQYYLDETNSWADTGLKPFLTESGGPSFCGADLSLGTQLVRLDTEQKLEFKRLDCGKWNHGYLQMYHHQAGRMPGAQLAACCPPCCVHNGALSHVCRFPPCLWLHCACAAAAWKPLKVEWLSQKPHVPQNQNIYSLTLTVKVCWPGFWCVPWKPKVNCETFSMRVQKSLWIYSQWLICKTGEKIAFIIARKP